MSFARHYTASNDCTPARSTLLTGLYTHQTGCMITGGSTLDPGFPTWGTMLREHGYHTRWYGKWHLTHHDNKWTAGGGRTRARALWIRGGHLPLARRRPGQGWRVDPRIAGQFADWFAHEGGAEPWCTTVSFVNPHDIAWWYAWSDRVPAEATAPRVVQRLPPNFETPELLLERNKPRLQRSLSGHRGRVVWPGAVHRPRSAWPMAEIPRPLREAPARGRPPHRPGPAHAGKPAGGGGEHRDRVHLRPRRVRRLARPARQGRERL